MKKSKNCDGAPSFSYVVRERENFMGVRCVFIKTIDK